MKFIEYQQASEVIVVVDDGVRAEERQKQRGGEKDQMLADWPIVGALVPSSEEDERQYHDILEQFFNQEENQGKELVPIIELARDPDRGLVPVISIENRIDVLGPHESLGEWLKSPRRRRAQRRIDRALEVLARAR